jgi:hypothetical protein
MAVRFTQACESSPPQPRRGGRDIKKKRAATSDGADGVVWSKDMCDFLTTPPRLRD